MSQKAVHNLALTIVIRHKDSAAHEDTAKRVRSLRSSSDWSLGSDSEQGSKSASGDVAADTIVVMTAAAPTHQPRTPGMATTEDTDTVVAAITAMLSGPWIVLIYRNFGRALPPPLPPPTPTRQLTLATPTLMC
ncbi:hypothetical protein J6590_018641 [Homalodisca vitripennis]|nr:hypothetical protein J6590_018641 [Homalodisca vitripennis]